MKPQVQWFSIICTIILALFVLHLVKKRKLREEYSLLWLLAIIVIAVFAFDRPLLTTFANLLGVSYAPSAIFIAAFTVGFFMLLNFSVIISGIMERNKRLTQEVGILRHKIEEIERRPPLDFNAVELEEVKTLDHSSDSSPVPS